MAEPLKNIYDYALLELISVELVAASPTFPRERFMQLLLADSWDARELKDRIRHVSTCLGECLEHDYKASLDILRILSPKFSGLAHLFIPDFVEQFGLDDYDESVQAMMDFTAGCSAEFAIRPFIKKYPSEMLAQMNRWVSSEDEHIRRLASEGSRSKLPWAMAVPYLKENPEAVIALLTQLKNDPSEYVRRSVANNLNDISKDYPELVITVATDWLGESVATDRLVKHASRTLLKQGNTAILRLFGYRDPSDIELAGFTLDDSLLIGDKLPFYFELKGHKESLGKLRLEYVIGFLLANGKHSNKVFKISEGTYSEVSRHVKKSHNFKAITTRRYYAGTHKLRIVVNGVEMGCENFELHAP